MTSVGALLTFGPSFRFTTRLMASGDTPVASTVAEPVTLVGSGDPLFSTSAYAHSYLGSNGDTVDALAAQLSRRTATQPPITHIAGGVHANDSIFDRLTLPPEWVPGDSGSIQPLSGMPTNEDFAGTRQSATVASPVLASAQRMRTALRHAKIVVSGAVGFGGLPKNPVTLAAVSSPPLASMLRIMNVPSDDFIAEQLVKAVGAEAHTPGTSHEGIARVVARLTAVGIFRPGDRIVDGSGLARRDRLTVNTLLRLLLDAERNPSWGTALIASLPGPGQGTLKGRMSGLGTRVHAKTGTLNDVSTLSGIVHASNGKTYAFSILCNGLKPTDILAARKFQDAVVRRLAHGVAG